ncbi:unnamed protein product, partial [Larinioides sclopetarius]
MGKKTHAVQHIQKKITMKKATIIPSEFFGVSPRA